MLFIICLMKEIRVYIGSAKRLGDRVKPEKAEIPEGISYGMKSYIHNSIRV